MMIEMREQTQQFIYYTSRVLFTRFNKMFYSCSHAFENTVGLTFQEAALQIFQAQRHRLRSDAVDAKTILLRVDRRDRMMMTDKPRSSKFYNDNHCYDMLWLFLLLFCASVFCIFCSALSVFSWKFLGPHTIQGLASARNLTLIQLEVLPQKPCRFFDSISKGDTKHQAPHVAGLAVMENQGLTIQSLSVGKVNEWMIQQVATELCWGTRLDDVQDLCCRDNNSCERTSPFYHVLL